MNEQEFEEWKVVFCRLAESELELLRFGRVQQIKMAKKQAKLIREFVRKVMKVVLDPRYGPIKKVTKDFELNRLLDIQDEAKRIEARPNKHQKTGPKTWPRGIKRMLIGVLEQAKGNRESLKMIRSFISPNGELKKWIDSKQYGKLISVSSIAGNPELPTKWANDLKANLIRSYILENHQDVKNDKSAKFKRYKKKFLTSLARKS